MSFELDFYKWKKVLLTGHTGFKGSWMSVLLVNADADVIGYSSCCKTETRLFDLCGVKDQITHIKEMCEIWIIFWRYSRSTNRKSLYTWLRSRL